MVSVWKTNVSMFWLLVMLLLMLELCPVASADVYVAPSHANFEILAAEVIPLPARPGGDMFVKVNIENYGKSPAENVVVEIEENYPFRFKYSNAEHTVLEHYTNTTVKIQKISAYGSYEAFYYFTVDSLAKSGEYELTFRIQRTREGTVGLVRNIKVVVEGTPDLILMNSSLSPQVITPGDEIILRTEVASVGTGNAKNIRVNLVLDDVSEVVALEGSSRFIQELDAGRSKPVSFKLKVSRDAELTSYSIPMTLSGIDETEELSVSSGEVIGFDVVGMAKLSVASIKTNPLIGKVGKELTLTIRIENVGDDDAKSAKASVLGLSFIGIKDAFLGEIEAGDDAPAVFTLIPDSGGEFAYTLQISYEDDFGEHTVTEDLNLIVEREKNGGLPGDYVMIALAVLVMVGVYCLFFRKRKEK